MRVEKVYELAGMCQLSWGRWAEEKEGNNRTTTTHNLYTVALAERVHTKSQSFRELKVFPLLLLLLFFLWLGQTFKLTANIATSVVARRIETQVFIDFPPVPNKSLVRKWASTVTKIRMYVHILLSGYFDVDCWLEQWFLFDKIRTSGSPYDSLFLLWPLSK